MDYQEIDIPVGMEAEIKGGKVIIRKKESEDERIYTLICSSIKNEMPIGSPRNKELALAYLEKQKEQSFTHHEIDESLRDAVTHQMEDDGDVDDFVRRGIDDIVLKYAELGARWQKGQQPIFKKGDKVIWDGEEFNILDVDKDTYNVGGYIVPFSREGELHPIGAKPAEKSEKPIISEWSEEDELMRNACIAFIQDEKFKGYERSYECVDWLKALRSKPKQEWSKEDKNRHYYLCNLLRETWDKVDKGSCIDDAITWFEELPERIALHSWKPSEEQMDALRQVISGCSYDIEPLVKIEEHLKQLREE